MEPNLSENGTQKAKAKTNISSIFLPFRASCFPMLDQIKALYRELYPEEPGTNRLPDNTRSNTNNPGKEPGQTAPTKAGAAPKLTPKPADYLQNEASCPDPQAKLEKTGIQSLTNTELLCLVLGGDAPALAAKVAQLLVHRPFAIRRQELQGIEGMQAPRCAAVLAAMELARRFPHPQPRQLNNPAAIYRQIVHFADQQENLIAINLNGACESLSVRLITRGTVNRSLIHPREVFTHAVREQANSVVIAHNHPSGHLEPSEEDLQSTQTTVRFGSGRVQSRLSHDLEWSQFW